MSIIKINNKNLPADFGKQTSDFLYQLGIQIQQNILENIKQAYYFLNQLGARIQQIILENPIKFFNDLVEIGNNLIELRNKIN